MSGCLDGLLVERARLKTEMAAKKQLIKQEEKKAAAAQRSAARRWQLTPWLKQVALAIYLHAEYRAAPAIKFLQTVASKRSWPRKEDQELQRMVEDLFAAADMQELLGLYELEEPDDPSVVAEVIKYVQEWRPVEYVRDMNSRVGVAPSTEDILRQLEANRLQLPVQCRPESKGTAAEAKAKMWAKRFRERWGGRHGKLRIEDTMCLADMEQKVHFSPTCVAFFC